MTKSMIRLASAAGVGAIALSLFATAPAFAGEPAPPRSVAAGQALYSISCNDDELDTTVFSVDELTGDSVALGASGVVGEEGECLGNAVRNPVDGKVYAPVWKDDKDYLGTIDLATGAVTLVGEITTGSPATSAEIYTLAIDAQGKAYATWDDGDGTRVLLSVDLATAKVTYISSFGEYDVYAFFIDQNDGTAYAIEEYGDVYTVDLTDGETTFVADLSDYSGLGEAYWYAAGIDADGVIWFVAERYSSDGATRDLYSVDDLFNVSDSVVWQGQLTAQVDGDAYGYHTESLILTAPPAAPLPAEEEIKPADVPEKALAETGVSASMPMFVGGALIVALLGGGLVAFSRLRRSKGDNAA